MLYLISHQGMLLKFQKFNAIFTLNGSAFQGFFEQIGEIQQKKR